MFGMTLVEVHQKELQLNKHHIQTVNPTQQECNRHERSLHSEMPDRDICLVRLA